MAKDDSKNDPIAELQRKLKNLEDTLGELLTATEQDLELARRLQALLMPQHLPEIPGVACYARYKSSRELSSESFELIPTQHNRELWILSSWTSSFGLSSLLLQLTVSLKAKKMLEKSAGTLMPTPNEVFDEITKGLVESQKKGSYRLMVAHLDFNTLKLSGVAVGQAPFFVRLPDESWALVKPDTLLKSPTLLERQPIEQSLMASNAYTFESTIAPGSRLFMTGKEWSSGLDVHQHSKALGISQNTLKNSSGLLNDLNQVMLAMQQQLDTDKRNTDLTVIGLEINPRILHLA